MAAAALWWLGFGDGVVGIIEREMEMVVFMFVLCVCVVRGVIKPTSQEPASKPKK